MSDTTTPDEIRERIRERYGSIAASVSQAEAPTPSQELPVLDSSCCASTATDSGCCQGGKDVISSDLYEASQLEALPSAAVLASLGCGNPTALAELRPGEVVLDLGSGGGIDVLLSARRVGPSGFAYGLDMTDEMLALAEQNRAKVGATNVQFLKGHIEQVPLADNTVDVIISNCVVNLSTDKDGVLREAFRVLKAGGRFAISDVVLKGRLPEGVIKNLEAWAGCVAGALSEDDYRAKLAAAGFVDVDVEVTRAYDPRELARGFSLEIDEATLSSFEAGGGAVVSAFVRARKP